MVEVVDVGDDEGRLVVARRIEDLMDENAKTLAEDATFKDVARLLAEERVSAMPVTGGDGRVVGVVSEADLILRDESFGIRWLPDGWAKRSVRRKAHAKTAGDLLSSPAVTVGPDAEVSEAAAIMRKWTIKQLPVCDDAGHLLGVLSRSDLLREFLREDTDLAFDVAELLWHKMSLPRNEVSFSVEDGVVTLEGLVEHRVQVPEILDRIRSVPGVVDVVDRLGWTDADTALAAGPFPWGG
jgi:CBS domain-containing protein